MRALLHCLLCVMFAGLSSAQELPPKESRGEWKELEEVNFAGWEIRKFLGWGIPFDGGSKVFFLEDGNGGRFDVMAAHPNYWTEEERKQLRQVFFLIRKDRFYRIEPKGAEEKVIIAMLEKAAGALAGEGKTDPKLLKHLAERMADRKAMFTPGVGTGF